MKESFFAFRIQRGNLGRTSGRLYLQSCLWRTYVVLRHRIKEPLQTPDAAGTSLPSTTLITKNRFFIPVPDQLAPEFRVTEGAKEFFVRFDVVVSSLVTETQ